MFAVRGLLASTIKPLLGRFVKRGMQTDTSNGLSVTNIELKEDALEEFLLKLLPAGNSIKIHHASVGSINVELSWTSALVKWQGILIGAEFVNEPVLATSPDARLGGSLIGQSMLASASALMESGSGDSLFNSALMGAQKRIENATSLIAHELDSITIHVKLSELITLEILAYGGKFSEANGLQLDSLLISKLEAQGPDLVIVKTDGIQLASNLSSVSVGDLFVKCDEVMSIIERTFRRGESTAQKTDLKLQIQATQKATIQYREMLFNATNTSASVSEGSVAFRCDLFTVAPVSSVAPVAPVSSVSSVAPVSSAPVAPPFVGEVSATSVKGSFLFGLAPTGNETPSCSAFDEGKLFMFRSHIRPVPLATPERLDEFFSFCRGAAHQRLTIECADLKASIGSLPKAFPSAPLAPSAPSDSSIRVIELKVGAAHLQNETHSVTTNGISAFLSLGQKTDWFVSASTIATPGCASVKNVRIAGQALERISADIAHVNLIGPEKTVTLVKQLVSGPAGEPINLFIRMHRARVAPNRWYMNSEVTVGMCDIFTIGEAFAVTAGTIESASLRINAIQAEIGTNIKLHAALVQMLVSPDDISNTVRTARESISSELAVTADVKPFCLNDHLIINDYVKRLRRRNDSTQPMGPTNLGETSFKLSITKVRLQLSNPAHSAGYAELCLDGLKVRVHPTRKRLSFDLLQCFDRTTQSTFNRAVVVRGAVLTLIDKEDYVIAFGGDSSRKKMEDVSLAIDQSFIEFLIAYFNQIKWGTTLTNEEAVVIRSIRVSAIKARVNYRPCSSSAAEATSEAGFARYIPIKEAVIKVGPFDGFGLTADELLVAFGMHVMKDKKNLARIVGGVKPIRASIEIFKNVTELILIPTHPVTPGYSNDVKGMLAQMQHVSARTIVSILELVPSSSQQPSGIKQGIIQAGQVFQRDMKTVVAFVSGENATTDLLDVPLMIIRPLTSPVSTLINGVCNQLDPVRLERIRSKYR